MRCKCECGTKCKHGAKCECEHEAKVQSEMCKMYSVHPFLSVCTGDISTKAMVSVNVAA